MPADSLRDAQLAGGRTYDVAHNRLPPERLPPSGLGTGKDPVLRGGVAGKLTPSCQSLCQVRVERDGLLRGLRLAGPWHLHHDRANHADLQAGEIDVLPFQSKQLTHSQSGANV